MRKTTYILFAAGVAATLLVPRAIGNEAQRSVLKHAGSDRTFADYLSMPSLTVLPWLDLDGTTKLPRGDYPLGRDVKAAPDLWRLALGEL
jgi:hypothetical protein